MEYSYGKCPDVISGLHFERLVSAGGPTQGHIRRPSDGKEPKQVAFIKCVGSRDDTKGKSYCSRACCMYTAKHAYQVKTKIEDSEAYVFYMDVRTAGKNYEEFYQRALNEGATFIRGRVSKIYPKGDKLVLKSEDTLIGRPIEVEVDMVVLATAMVPSQGSLELAKTIGFSTDKDGWYQEAHPKLQPVETFSAGVYLAGACQGPKDIPDSVAQASAAAVKVCGLFSKSELGTHGIRGGYGQVFGMCFMCTHLSARHIPERDSGARRSRSWTLYSDGSRGKQQFVRVVACIPACRLPP